MHRGAFTRSNKLKLAAVLREKPLAGAFGNSLAPQKSRLFPTKFLFDELFSKHIRTIFLKQVPIQKLSSPHCDEMEGREIRRSRRGASALKIRLRRLHTSGLPYERPRATRALWWGAPQTADPPTPGPKKHQKSFRRVGESFLARIRVAHERLQEHSPTPPVWRVPKIRKKCRFDTFFGQFSTFRKSQNAVNYRIFAF